MNWYIKLGEGALFAFFLFVSRRFPPYANINQPQWTSTLLCLGSFLFVENPADDCSRLSSDLRRSKVCENRRTLVVFGIQYIFQPMSMFLFVCLWFCHSSSRIFASPNGVFRVRNLQGLPLVLKVTFPDTRSSVRTRKATESKGSFWGRYTVLISHVLQGSHV